jgi:hypothetical protein
MLCYVANVCNNSVAYKYYLECTERNETHSEMGNSMYVYIFLLNHLKPDIRTLR